MFKCVILTIDSGQSDLKIRQEEGIPALRRERIKRVTKEAFKQGTLLTAEDMAYKIFSVGYRTINTGPRYSTEERRTHTTKINSKGYW